MCCNFPTIKITEGNAFTLIFPLKRRSYVAERPIDEDIDVTRLSNVHVTLGGVEYAPTIETYGVRIDVPATLVRGTYDGLLTADYDGNAIRGAYESCVQIVAWNAQSNAQQYILGSPVATKAAYVLGYMPTDTEVEALKQQLREQIAAAEQAEAEAIAEKERYAEAIKHLDDIAQESTLMQGVSDIRNDIANIDVGIPTDYAKETTAQQAAADAAAAKVAAEAITGYALQGDDSTATNTAIKAEVDGLTGIAGDITAGKAAIKEAVELKGVKSKATTLTEYAQEIRTIQQQPITIDGGEMYEKQLFGAPTSKVNVYDQPGSPLWNLYVVLSNILSDMSLLDSNGNPFTGIILAEYLKDCDSISLQGCPLGGAYFTCDGDLYRTDTVHVWHDNDNGKINRWVAYLLAGETQDANNYTIPSTELCPYSIYIGRLVGTITCSVAGHIREIVVPDGTEQSPNSLLGTNFTSTQVWQQEVKLDVKHNKGGALFQNNTNVVSVILDELEDTTDVLFSKCTNLIGIKITKLKNISLIKDNIVFESYPSFIDLRSLQEVRGSLSFPKASYINLESLNSVNNFNFSSSFFLNSFSVLKKLELPSLTYLSNGNRLSRALSDSSSLEEIYTPLLSHFGCKSDGGTLANNANLKKITFGKLTHFYNHTSAHDNPFYSCPKLEYIIIGQGVDINLYFWKWNPTTVLSTPEGIAQINANIRNHIAANVADGNNTLTFTVSTNLLNNLEQATLDAFAAKHWIVAGA